MNTLPVTTTRRQFLTRLTAVPVLLTPLRALALGSICLGIVVIIVAAVIIYYLVKKCINIKPKDLPPEAIGYTISHARLQLLPEECTTTRLADEPGAATGTVDVEFDPAGVATITRRPVTSTQAESITDLRRLGLDPDKASASLYTAPAPLAACPISISTPPGAPVRVVVSAPAARDVAVQRSADLTTWETVFTARIPTGYRVRFSDLDDGPHKFYRLVNL